MGANCPSINTENVDPSPFWDSNGIHWDAHRTGWAVSAGCTLLTVIVTLFSVTFHLRNYYVPAEQKQIVRILFMPPVYAIISFLSYRFYRSYTYYELAENIYESLALVAFLFLLVQYVGKDPEEQTEVLKSKDKLRLPFPFNCIRYRPGKPYFMHTLKWSVLQYVLFRPLLTIAGIVCESFDVLCSQSSSLAYANVYLTIVDTISISVAIYGLIVFYELTRKNLAGKRPLAKFLSIKTIVGLVWGQGIVFTVLSSNGYIKGTEYWTTENIADGLNGLCTCVEMIIFAAYMCFAFSWSEYKKMKPYPGHHTPVLRSFFSSQNYADFAREAWWSLKFIIDFIRRKPYTRNQKSEFDFDRAFCGAAHHPPEGTEMDDSLSMVTIVGSSEVKGFKRVDSGEGEQPVLAKGSSTVRLVSGGRYEGSGERDAVGVAY